MLSTCLGPRDRPERKQGVGKDGALSLKATELGKVLPGKGEGGMEGGRKGGSGGWAQITAPSGESARDKSEKGKDSVAGKPSRRK